MRRKIKWLGQGDERDDVVMYNRIGSGIFTWALHGMYFEMYILIDEIKFSLRSGVVRDKVSIVRSQSRPLRMLYGTAVVPAFDICLPRVVLCVYSPS